MFQNGWRRRNPIFGLIGACVATVPLIFLGIQAIRAAAPFIWIQPTVLNACKACLSAPLDGANPYRRGRVLVVNSSGMALGLVLADKTLTGIAATSPKEVGTLIRVGDPVTVQMGVSASGAKLTQTFRDICLIDWSTKQVIYRTSLAGSKPSISS
ncbi:MAG: hypothetical protein ACYCZF_10830 [Anaerolineae bacterium]